MIIKYLVKNVIFISECHFFAIQDDIAANTTPIWLYHTVNTCFLRKNLNLSKARKTKISTALTQQIIKLSNVRNLKTITSIFMIFYKISRRLFNLISLYFLCRFSLWIPSKSIECHWKHIGLAKILKFLLQCFNFNVMVKCRLFFFYNMHFIKYYSCRQWLNLCRVTLSYSYLCLVKFYCC